MSAIDLVNLLPQEVLLRRTRRVVLRNWVAVGALAFGLVAIGAIGVRAPAAIKQVQLERSASAFKGQIGDLEAEIAAGTTQLAVVERRLRMIQTLEDRPDWGVLLAFLSQNRGEGVTLSLCDLTWTDQGVMTLQVVGHTDTPGNEGTLVRSLDRSGLFTTTTLLGTRRQVIEGVDRIVFEVSCVFRPEEQKGATP